jgi:hypothetical protein
VAVVNMPWTSLIDDFEADNWWRSTANERDDCERMREEVICEQTVDRSIAVLSTMSVTL